MYSKTHYGVLSFQKHMTGSEQLIKVPEDWYSVYFRKAIARAFISWYETSEAIHKRGELKYMDIEIY